ncbi:FAD binding domain-containing protein [Desulfitobacterium hafniense]|nr:FAD binding domain-containing protein [Desulfitobacterium hafniense]
MKDFKLINAASLEEAVSGLQQSGAVAKAGGTDLLGAMKKNILPHYPKVVVNIDSIQGLDYIKEEDGMLKIGALAKLAEVAENSVVKEKYTALAEAAKKTASPNLRNMGTIGGNICQYNRCWYLRASGNYFDCLRKGGSTCYAISGDNRFHSIFGGIRIEGGLPCADDCPSGIAIPDYLGKVKAGDMAGAAAILLESNPLPAMTGRVCPHFCEDHCNRGDLDEAVSIRDLERKVGDYILEHASELIKAPEKESGKKAAVIGAGPAGLAAAFYLRLMGHSVTIIDAKEEAGGMLTYAIPAYRLPKEIVKKQVNALKATGIEFNMGVRIGQDIQLDKLMADYDAVFVACGAWKEKPTGIKGEELLLSGLNFLNDVAGGMSKLPKPEKTIVCADRGGCSLIGGVQHVAVLGGGNTAIDVARTLQRMGAVPVIVYRRTIEEMPAIKHDIEKAIEEGIEIRFLTQPVEAAQKGAKVVLTCSKMELGEPDASGRRRPVAVLNSEFNLEFDAVITAFGEDADTSFVPSKYLDGKWLKADGAYVGDNLFSGGDYLSGPSTVTQAMASGKKAAKAINAYLGGEEQECGCTSECSGLLDLSNPCMEQACRAVAPEMAVAERIKNLTGEDVASLDDAAFGTEANRCLNCGCVAVNCSDTAPALIALDAQIITTKRTIPADKFWSSKAPGSTILENDELVTEIRIPVAVAGSKSAFLKLATRATIDFPIVNCAVVISGKDARVCLNAVHPNPYRACKAEDLIKGKVIDEALAEAAGEAAVSDAIAMPNNAYKIQMAKVIVKRTILACK